MGTRTTRPGPVAYMIVGTLIGFGLITPIIRVVSIATGVYLPPSASALLPTVGTAAFVTGAGLLCHLIIKHFRAVQAEDRTEMSRLQRRVDELENQMWWGDKPATAEDGIPKSGAKVTPLRGRRSS